MFYNLLYNVIIHDLQKVTKKLNNKFYKKY